MTQKETAIPTTIAPWLTVQNGARALDFYKIAFDAIETYRLEDPDGGLVVQLSIDGAAFWLSGSNAEDGNSAIPSNGGVPVRMIVTVNNPDVLFKKAIDAGASQVFPIGEEHDWRLGRLVDPFGFHWEIGHPLF